MKIAFVITGLGLGGAEVQVSQLATGLAARGVEVCLLSMIAPTAVHPVLRAAGIAVRTLGMTRGRASVGHLVRYAQILRSWRPDVVHSHMFHANLLARLGRPVVRAPVICTVHNTFEMSQGKSINPSERMSARELVYRITDPVCALTTQVSRAGAARCQRVRAVPSRKLTVVPNGIDAERFRPSEAARVRVRRALHLGEQFVWLWIGRLAWAKDPWNMLDSFRLKDPARQSVLLMVGTGPLEGEIGKRIDSMGLAGRVRLLGPRHDIPDVMAAADAFVLSSYEEGLPMVLLEAASSGLPIITTSAGGASEAVEEGITGWVVPPRDATSLAGGMEAMERLEPGARRRMGAVARSRAIEHFSLERILDRWISIYQDVARQG